MGPPELFDPGQRSGPAPGIYCACTWSDRHEGVHSLFRNLVAVDRAFIPCAELYRVDDDRPTRSTTTSFIS